MNDKIYDTLKKIFTSLIFISGVMGGVSKIWDISSLVPIAATISIVAYAGLEYLQNESKKYFTEHDIVEAGHITFLNPELHKD